MAPVSLPVTRNLALGKPATQSSVSAWSSGKTPEADARIATNGDTTSAAFFHTAAEAAPWWLVDLQEPCVIRQVRIFNRRDLAERLTRFTVLASQTAAPDSWVPIYCKNDDVVFGHNDNAPFVIVPAEPSVARFVQIRKDDPGFLHFRECEVWGHKSGSEDPTMPLHEMESTEHRLAIERRAALTDGRTGTVTQIDSFSVFVDTAKYSETLIRALTESAYEGAERILVRAAVLPTDRVLEVGTAVGVVTMTAAAIVGPSSVMTYDANPAMVADARRNFTANGLSEIRAQVGVMRNRSRWSDHESEVDFFVSRDFWGSRLHATLNSPDITHVVRVPLLCLENTIAEHQANVLICDIEGGEADLLDGADLAPIRLIVLEIHYWATGHRRIDEMFRFLVLSGFNINFDHTSRNIILLERGN